MYQENQLMDDELEVDETTRILSVELVEQGVVSAFFEYVQHFYSTFVTTMMKKSPFQFSDLCILNPAERLGYHDFPNVVVRLAKIFLVQNLSRLRSD